MAVFLSLITIDPALTAVAVTDTKKPPVKYPVFFSFALTSFLSPFLFIFMKIISQSTFHWQM